MEDALKVQPLMREIVTPLIEKSNQILQNVKPSSFIRTRCYRQGPVKNMVRLKQKAENDYKGNFVEIKDVVRGCFELDDNLKIAAVSSVLDWACENEVPLPHGARVVISDNRFKDPTETGYSSHKANIAIPIPDEPGRWHISELMLYHSGFEKQIKEDKKNKFSSNSHESYEKLRYLKGIAKNRGLTRDEAKSFGFLRRALKDIHRNARKAYCIDDIENPLQKFSSRLQKETWAQYFAEEAKENRMDLE